MPNNEDISLEELIMFQDAETNDETVILDPEPETTPESTDDSDTSTEDEQSETEESENEDTVPEETHEEPEVDTDAEVGEEGATSSYQTYFKNLSEGGFLHLPEDDEFDDSPEGLEAAIKASDDNKTEAIKNSLLNSMQDNKARALFQHLNAGGSLQQFMEVANDIDLSAIDVTNVSHQRRLAESYYRQTTKLSEEKITRMIDRLADMDALQETAEEILPELQEIETERAKELAQQSEQQKLAAIESAKQTRLNLETSIKEAEALTSTRKNKIKAFMFNEITRGESTATDYNRVLSQISSNPSHIIQLADFLMDYDKEKGFSASNARQQRKGKSKATSSFRKSLETNIDSKTKVGGKTNAVPSEDVDWEALLTQLG